MSVLGEDDVGNPNEARRHEDVASALNLVFAGIARLQSCCLDGRRFTIDGRLVGDIGEMVAAREFEIELDKRSQAVHDGETTNGQKVQIKATFKDSLTLSKQPELYIGLKLYPDGKYDVVFNGPGSVIVEAFKHRKGIGEKLLSFPIKRLAELSAELSDEERVPVRKVMRIPRC